MIKKLFSFFFDKSLAIFLIIGALNTVVSLVGTQWLLGPISRQFGPTAGYWGSTAIMYTLCSVFSFIFNRKYSFESKAPLKQSILRFSVVILVCYLLSFGFSQFITPAIVGLFSSAMDTTWVSRIAVLVGMCIFTALNYVGQRVWAFKE